MKLTEEQRNSIKYGGNTFIVACPGSGKTRTLIAKLLRCVDEVRETALQIACITYTNAGVYEIENRLRTYGKPGDEDYCDISTIHSFCLNNILRYFYWRLEEYLAGFTILPPDSDRYREIVSNICSDYGLRARDYDQFELLNREPDGTPIVSDQISPDIALDFWERLRQERYIDFPNIIYFSYRLLSQRPSIAHALACRFAWILVDEFQDTSALQVEILRLIAERGRSKFFLVGDPYQSIYGFAGARPELMEVFVNEINAKRDFRLLSNFRSSNAIISHAEKLCPRTPAMQSVGEAERFTEVPQYIHAENAFEAITDYFIPALDELGINYGNAAILAPWWVKLLHLSKQLRDYGIPIIGPGARPYKRNHLFALLAEQLCAYIEHPLPSLIPQIERELFLLLNTATSSLNFSVFSYSGRTTVFKLIKKSIELRDQYNSGIQWLKQAVQELSAILCKDEFLPESCIHLLTESVNDMESDMIKNQVDVENLTVNDLGMFANTRNNLHLRTIHRAKGLEFDAVAIIDLHEGRLPHFTALTSQEIDEARRLLYVAMTRAKRILMYITDNENPRTVPSRFLYEGELGIIQS
jgi:DNA helicase-2/ATP-dependent DNA helicase PcrA